jgi:hypothetical protein
MFGSRASHSGLRATIGDQQGGHRAIILKHLFEDGNGKVKIYEDTKGLARQGKILIFKDTDIPGGTVRYKKIEVYSVGEELLGAINMYPKDKFSPHPVYRFFYDQTEIGSGNGDIALFVAHEIVSRTIQARSGAGTSIDGEIITTIKQILQIKR